MDEETNAGEGQIERKEFYLKSNLARDNRLQSEFPSRFLIIA